MTAADVTFHISVGPNVGSACIFLMQVIAAAIGLDFEIQPLHARWLAVPEGVAALSQMRHGGVGVACMTCGFGLGLHGDPGFEVLMNGGCYYL